MATIAIPISGVKIITAGVTVKSGTAGAAITAGQWLYASGTGEVSPADASTAAKATVVGIAILDASSTEPCYYVSNDDIQLSGFASLTENTKYVLSGTSGQMELLTDMTTNEYVTYLCTALEGSTTDFKIQVEVTGQQAA